MKAADRMTATKDRLAARWAQRPRRLWAAVAVMSVLATAIASVVVATEESADAAPPAVGDPGVLPAVDLNSLNPDPIKQWGVVGTGNSYTAPKSQVWDFLEIGDRIYVAGIFTGVQRNGDDPTSQVISQAYLAAFDRDSGAYIPTFAPQLNRAVYALAMSANGNLLVGGEFTTVNGQSRTGLVMLDPATGATVPGFTTSISAGSQPMVRDILRVGSQIYIAGQFSGAPGSGSGAWLWNAARLDSNTGVLDNAWIPQFMGGIWQVAVDQSRGRVHAAGFFTSLAGQPGTKSFATVTEATGAYIPGLAPFEHNAPNGQTDTVGVVYADNKLWVGGAQHVISVLDADTNSRIGYETTGMICTTFVPCGYNGGGDFQTLEVAAGGIVLGGCHCYAPNTAYSSFAGAYADQRFAVAIDSSNGQFASSFVPGLKQRSVGTYAIHVDSKGCYYVGGDFTRQADGEWLGGFGRFCRTILPPANVAATSTSGGATVTWQAPVNQIPTAYYKVYRDGTFLGDTAGLVYGVGNLTQGNTYTFTVRTVDVAGRISATAAATVTIAGPDTTAPTSPTNVTGTATGSTVNLSWTASVDLPNPGGVGLSGYLVHRDYNYVGFVPAGTTTFADPNVTDGVHRYEVRAIDRSSNMTAPVVVNVTVGTPPPPDTLPPTVPASPVGTSPSSGIVNLSWGASVDLPNPGGVGLSGYLVHRDWNYIAFVPAGTTTFSDTGVPDGNRRYEIRSVDRDNRMSAPAVLNVQAGPPPVPDTLPPTVPGDVVAATPAPGTVTLNWSASVDLPNPGGVGLSGYLIHRDWNYIAFVPAGTTTFTDTGVPAGNRRYEVRAVDLGNLFSAPSPALNVVVP